MENLFRQVLNMSITGSYVILAVLTIRLLLRKAPKKYAYALWGVVAFRLACPVSFRSAFSLLNLLDLSRATPAAGTGAIQYVPENIGLMPQPEITVGIPAVNHVITESLPAPVTETVTSVNPMQIWMFVAAVLWCVGVVALLTYSFISYSMIHRRMRSAVLLEGNVWQSDRVRSPFILGFVKPKIYIPFGLSEETLGYVLAHERYHIRRLDHLVKPLAFLLLTVHWFNPLCWLAFHLMGKDMEMSCDEKVLSGQENIRKAYSSTLLSFAVGHRFPAPSPLAFGESSVKSRIKNALHWKKPALWVTIGAVAVCVAAVAICAADPKEENLSETPIGHTYRMDSMVYANGMFSFVPTPDHQEDYCLTADMLLLEKREEGWVTLGTLESFDLTKENFDDLMLSADTGGMWSIPDVFDGKDRAASIRSDVKRAWQVDIENSDLNDFIYILQEEDGETYLAYGYHEHGDAGEPMIRWIFTLWRTDYLTVTVSSDSGKQEHDIEPVWYGPSDFDDDYESLALATVVGQGAITFNVDWDCDTLTVEEHHSLGNPASSGYEYEKETYKLHRNNGGLFVLNVSRRSELMEEEAIFYVTDEREYGKYLFKVEYPLEVPDGGMTEFIPLGSYDCIDLIYLTPFNSSSTFGTDDNGFRYEIDETGVTIIEKETGKTQRMTTGSQNWRTISNTEWQNMFLADGPDISGFQTAVIWELSEYDSLLYLDGRLWILSIPGVDYVWSIHELAPVETDDGRLTAAEIQEVNERFEPIVYDKRGEPIGVNPLSCFVTSYYLSTTTLDLNEFMAYFPNGVDLSATGGKVSAAEFAALKKHPDWPFGEDRTQENMPVPIHKYERRQVDMILNEYAGITTADHLSGTSSDGPTLIYLEEYDAYYNFTSDFGPGTFHCVGGLKKDDWVYLYSAHSLLALQQTDGRYLIRYFMPMHASDAQESSISAYDMNGDGILQLAEFPVPDGAAFDLRGEEAYLYTTVARERARRLYSLMDADETFLMLPALKVYGQYEGENGETHYICQLLEQYYYDLGTGLTDPKNPVYSSIGGAGTFVRVTLAADGSLVDWQETYDGADNTERIKELCGPLTDLAEACNNDTVSAKWDMPIADELLMQYLEHYFI